MRTLAQCARILEEKTPAEIALYLRRKGITGRPGDACGCPIANWFRAETGQGVAVAAGYIKVTATFQRIDQPLSVAAFVDWFDAGWESDLLVPLIDPQYVADMKNNKVTW